MPAGETLEPIVAAAMRAEAMDEKRASLSAAQGDPKAIARLSGVDDATSEPLVLERQDFPTPEEMATLRRVPNHIPVKLFTIAFIELCERFSYYGSTVVCKSPRLAPPRLVSVSPRPPRRG